MVCMDSLLFIVLMYSRVHYPNRVKGEGKSRVWIVKVLASARPPIRA
jgi:hypothetical protein